MDIGILLDGVEVTTVCHVLGVDLPTPIIRSAITSPIPAIMEGRLMEVALGPKEAGSHALVILAGETKGV
jgi:hypothetical protein